MRLRLPALAAQREWGQALMSLRHLPRPSPPIDTLVRTESPKVQPRTELSESTRAFLASSRRAVTSRRPSVLLSVFDAAVSDTGIEGAAMKDMRGEVQDDVRRAAFALDAVVAAVNGTQPPLAPCERIYRVPGPAGSSLFLC